MKKTRSITRRSLVAGSLVLGAFMLQGCNSTYNNAQNQASTINSTIASTAAAVQQNKDWHTYSNYNEVVSTHVDLDVDVDFAKKQLTGSLTHKLRYIKKDTKELILDTRDLDIHGVKAKVNGYWQKTTFTVGKRDAILGSKLTIALPKGSTDVKIDYNSRPEASGLQWLNPVQTAGKKLPFMFSQSQATHGRSWLPIQDTPAMRVTYSAKIRTPSDLRAVMSADNNPQWNKNNEYTFNMPQAIPPYLIAIAVGNIHHKAMSRQTAIYSEPQMLDISAKEFEDTQAMIDTTEKLFGEYRWGQYDLLILPPSFPFGGMENPRLSFITPTVLAGDKSLVNLIAHELAHSWSGNLVTNSSWRDLWLNEGFTSYVENRIMEEVFGEKRALMEQALDSQGLRESIKDMESGDTILHMVIEGRDPDDSFSSVPYTKGQLFLIFLEQRFGRKDFDVFLRNYFDDHAFGSIDTLSFVKYINAKLINKHPGKVSAAELNTWIFEPGLPAYAPDPKSEVFNIVQQHMDGWLKGSKSLAQIPTADWTVHEWLYFINNLPKDITIKQLTALDSQFALTQSKNNEIALVWLALGIEKQYKAINTRLEQHLTSIGRTKLIKPLYKALIKDDSMNEFVKRVYKKARAGYHPVTQTAIDLLFKNKAEDKKKGV